MAGFNANQVKLQVGVQSVKGTGVAAVKQLNFVEKRNLKIGKKVEELTSLGTLDKVAKIAFIRNEPEGSIEGVVNADETFLFWYSMLGDVTPATVTDGHEWVWTNPLTAYAYKFLTMEFVDGKSGGINYKTIDSVIKSFEFKVSPDKAIRFTADYLALSVASAVATALTPSTVAPLLPKNSKIYIDNAGATPFTTLFSDGGVEMTLKYNSGLENVMYIGTSDLENKEAEGELMLNVRWGSVAKAMLDAELATGTSHKLIGFTNLDAVTNQGIKVWFAAEIKELPELPADAKGVVSAKYVFTPVKDTTNGSWLHVSFINNVESIALLGS